MYSVFTNGYFIYFHVDYYLLLSICKLLQLLIINIINLAVNINKNINVE